MREIICYTIIRKQGQSSRYSGKKRCRCAFFIRNVRSRIQSSFPGNNIPC